MAITCDCPMSQPGPTLAATCGGGAFMLFMGLLEVFLRSQCDLEDPCGRAQVTSECDITTRLHRGGRRLSMLCGSFETVRGARVESGRQDPWSLRDCQRCPSGECCSWKQVTTECDITHDFIVVGRGSAGSVVAARLSEVPEWRPTGAQVPSMFLNFIGSSIDWGYQTEPEPAACLGEEGRKCYWPRGKVLGGTSVMNGMMYIRGSRADYDSWAAAGNEGWSYEDVLPYFMKSEDNKQVLGGTSVMNGMMYIRGSRADYDSWAAAGNEGWSYEDVLPYFMKSEDNKQVDKMDQGYHGVGGPLTVSQFPYHPPLSYSLVKAGEELGYESRDLNGEQHTGFSIAQTTNRNGSRLSAARAFLRPARHRPNLHIMLNATVARVLINQTTRQAGGAVASPQLLQLSGVGEPAVLARAGVPLVHALPAVGRNLHNHVAHFINFHVNDNNTATLNWATAMEYLLFRDGLMSGTGISEVTAFINTKFAEPLADDPDVQLFFGGFLADCAKTGMVGERLDNGSRSIQIIPTVLKPKSIKFAIRLSETKALKRYGVKLDKTPVKGCETLKFGCDAYWECAVRMQTAPENHQAGSCKMGPRGDPSAVVDNLLQVQGVDRLRVADASVMPAVPSGNTNAPTIMIGERAADFIKRRWQGKPQAHKKDWDFRK
ncbi:Glucose dehydrogenase [acceptor] [Operophtera brumata]|uniref:Glucose dehydrogenase [acceptor] n=1 Tax=Operophtera brumata TaxID=104452 RepID=A0A0L7L578_OPEBR|nr:Glucose dehydrogenase [acceptor] [Operophtera brumata]